MVRAALRENALRPGAARDQLSRGAAGDGRRTLRLGGPRHLRLRAARPRQSGGRVFLRGGCRYSAGSGEPGESRGSKAEGQQAEGAFYVWTKEELGRVLAGDAGLFCVALRRDGRRQRAGGSAIRTASFAGKNILRQRQPLAETAKQFGLDPPAAGDRLLACLTRLRDVRARRPRPQLDDKILTAWNGLMISALAKGHVPGRAAAAMDPRSTDRVRARRAGRAAEFLRRELYDGRPAMLYRSYREGRSDIPGFAEDYAYLIQGLLDLYEASFEFRWLQWAERLQAKMDELFWDADGRRLFQLAGGRSGDHRADEGGLRRGGARAGVGGGGAIFCGLSWMLGGKRGSGQTAEDRLGYRERAVRCIEAMRGQWGRAPQALPQMLCALELALATAAHGGAGGRSAGG